MYFYVYKAHVVYIWSMCAELQCATPYFSYNYGSIHAGVLRILSEDS